MDPAIARRNSSSSASPYLTDVYHDAAGDVEKPTGNLTVGECLRLAKVLTDHTQLPASCRAYIEKQTAVQKAYEGAGGNMAARAVIAKHASRGGTGLTHAQLQRRWTSRRDPLEKKKAGSK